MTISQQIESRPHTYQSIDPAAFDSNCIQCDGKLRDSVHIDRCCHYWNSMNWRDKETFLSKNGFKPGWSSHTWQYLDRPIQSAFELNHGIL